MANIYSTGKAKDGTQYKVQYNKSYGTLFMKPKGRDNWQKVQTSSDLKFLNYVMSDKIKFSDVKRKPFVKKKSIPQDKSLDYGVTDDDFMYSPSISYR